MLRNKVNIKEVFGLCPPTVFSLSPLKLQEIAYSKRNPMLMSDLIFGICSGRLGNMALPTGGFFFNSHVAPGDRLQTNTRFYSTIFSDMFPGSIGKIKGNLHILEGSHKYRFYSPEVKEHFNNPRNVGSFDKDDPSVGTAIVGKAACGDVIKFQVKIEDGIIKDACFKTFGCGSAIASSSFVTELVKGMKCNEAINIKNTDISEKLNLPPVKVHCSLLAEDAVKHAIQDYLKKNKIEPN